MQKSLLSIPNIWDCVVQMRWKAIVEISIHANKSKLFTGSTGSRKEAEQEARMDARKEVEKEAGRRQRGGRKRMQRSHDKEAGKEAERKA